MKKAITVFVLFLMLFSICTCSLATDAETSPLQPVSTCKRGSRRSKKNITRCNFTNKGSENIKDKR